MQTNNAKHIYKQEKWDPNNTIVKRFTKVKYRLSYYVGATVQLYVLIWTDNTGLGNGSWDQISVGIVVDDTEQKC